MVDYLLVGIIFLIFFFFFFHSDIWYIGFESQSYLFGSPIDFYENNKRIFGTTDVTNYPPTLYLLFALWLYPFKLLGLIDAPTHFEYYWVYWLKILTTIVYAIAGVIFYRICLICRQNREWARYATVAWLTMPLAVFSQFVFCQCDAFYVALTLGGVLLLLRSRILAASLCFGVALTFKYFPAFVFIPLLLLIEKRAFRIALCGLVFILPTVLVDAPYWNSPAFVEGVRHFVVLGRVFTASIEVGPSGLVKLYILPLTFAAICGLAVSVRPWPMVESLKTVHSRL